MNWLDLVLGLFLLLIAYIGWCLRALLLVKIIACVYFAPWFAGKFQRLAGGWLDARVHEWVPGESLAYWLGIVLGVALVFLVFRLVTKSLEKAKLGYLDQGLGAGLALVLSLALLVVIFMRMVPGDSAVNTRKFLNHSWFCHKAFPAVERNCPGWEDSFNTQLRKFAISKLSVPTENLLDQLPLKTVHRR